MNCFHFHNFLFDVKECTDLAWCKTIFRNAVLELFEPFIKANSDNFEWFLVKRFYNDFKREFTNLYCLRTFCEFVFELFFIFDCDDAELMLKLIYIYDHVVTIYGTLELCNFCKLLRNPKHHLYENSINTHGILRKINNISENALKFTNREFYSKLTDVVIVQGNYTTLRFLVKYGLCYFPGDVLKHVRAELQNM